MSALRPELVDLPDRMRTLPLDERGYLIAAFVDTVNGKRDFRFMSQTHWRRCIEERRCWVCSGTLGGYLAFVVGPMCSINRTTSEPPCHRDCAIWPARFCPFLSRPRMVRREDESTRAGTENVAGCPILRNPGVVLVWITRNYKIFRDHKGAPLIEIGEPIETLWFRMGRAAMLDEIEESIATGLPALEELANLEKHRGAVEDLQTKVAEFRRLLPARQVSL
jgi:hypothetical protein